MIVGMHSLTKVTKILMKNKQLMLIIILFLLQNSKGFEVTCDTQFSDLEHSITYVLCPADCWRQYSNLCGDRIYSRGPICLAAMQDQWIDGGGGPVVVYRSPGKRTNRYSGGNRNAVKSESCSADGDSYSFEVTCSTQGDSSTLVTQVNCPAYCTGEAVYGSGIYSDKSSVCTATVHAGALPDKGGMVIFYTTLGQSSYNGSTSNGVESKSDSASKGAFAFTNINECVNNACEHGSTCVDGIAKYFCLCTPGYYGKYCEKEFTHCWNGNLTGKFVMKSGDEVVCSKGWLVLQRRFDGSVDFQIYWSDYRNGFGSLIGEFWWGLEKLHIATKPFQCNQCRLRVELKDIDNETSYAEYSQFRVGPESSNYQLCVGGQYNGTAGDSMVTNVNNYNSSGLGFSTRDRDNDNAGKHCADISRRNGGWWFYSCSLAVPNGAWNTYPACPTTPQFPCHAHWNTYKNGIRLIGTELKFRCDI